MSEYTVTMSSILHWTKKTIAKENIIIYTKNAQWLSWMKPSCWANCNEEERTHHLPAVVLHRLPAVVLHQVNTCSGTALSEYRYLCTGVACCAARRKKYDKCQQSKTIITHFAHKTKLKLMLVTKCQSTTFISFGETGNSSLMTATKGPGPGRTWVIPVNSSLLFKGIVTRTGIAKWNSPTRDIAVLSRTAKHNLQAVHFFSNILVGKIFDSNTYNLIQISTQHAMTAVPPLARQMISLLPLPRRII